MTIYRFYKEIGRLNDEELLEKAVHLTTERRFKKGEYIVRAGDFEPDLFFTVHGVVRGVVIDDDGNEFTECFGYRLGSCIRASNQPRPDIPAPISVQVMEDDSTYYVIPVKEVQYLMATYPDANAFGQRSLQDAFEMHRGAERALHQYNTVDRYKWFLKEYPGLIDRVEKQYIASFLSMDPATLSRLRRSIQEQQS